MEGNMVPSSIKNKKMFKLRVNNYLWILFVLMVGVVSNFPLVSGQYNGNDEVGQRGSSERIIDAVKNLDMEQLSITVANQYHPPLKYIMPIPGLLVSESEKIYFLVLYFHYTCCEFYF
jgi:hypothetical protein